MGLKEGVACRREEHVGDIALPRTECTAAANHIRKVREPERIRKPLWISGELRRRGVRKELALARYSTLDEPREEGADRADKPQRDAGEDIDDEERQRTAALALAFAARNHNDARAVFSVSTKQRQHALPKTRDGGNASDKRSETKVKPHVAVQDVAELVRNNTLQLIARKPLKRAASHAYGRRRRVCPRRKRVDSAFSLKNPYGRHVESGRDGHLLADIEKTVSRKVGFGVRRNLAAAQARRAD